MATITRRIFGGTVRACVRSNQTSSSSSVPNVKGLSEKVLTVPNGEVGPGAAKTSTYKNPEYFCYNNTSYFEAEVEMLKFRLPQPSSKKRFILGMRCFSDDGFQEEYQRACSGVCEIVPQSKDDKPRLIAIYHEKPKPTLCLEEIVSTMAIPKNVISCCGSDVGPGASKTGVYKNAEYFCYHSMSYYEAMNNLRCYRVPDARCNTCDSIQK